MSFTSGTLVYWDTHSGFAEIELDDRDGRIGIYRTDLLRAGVKAPLVGDRFHFSTEVVSNGAPVAIGLCPDIGYLTGGSPLIFCLGDRILRVYLR